MADSEQISKLYALCGDAVTHAKKGERTVEEIEALLVVLQKFNELTSGKKIQGEERKCVILDPVRGMQPKDGKPCSPQDCSHYPSCKG